MTEPTYTITCLYGVKHLEPVKYWIEERRAGPWWWRRTEYYIASEFMSLGPYDNRADANATITRFCR